MTGLPTGARTGRLSTPPMDHVGGLLSRLSPGEWAEIFIQDKQQHQIAIKDTFLSEASAVRAICAEVTVIRDGRVGAVHTSSLEPGALSRALERARKLAAVMPGTAEGLPPIPVRRNLVAFAEQEQLAPQVTELGDRPRGHTDRVRVAQLLERLTLARAGQITRRTSASYGEARKSVTFADSSGYSASYSTAESLATVTIIARSGSEAATCVGATSAGPDGCLDLSAAADEAADAASSLVACQAQSVSAGLPVVLSSLATARLLSRLWPALAGHLVRSGKSCIAPQLGRRIAARTVTLIDDPTDRTAPSWAPFDESGTPTVPQNLIRAGQLLSLLEARGATAGRPQLGGNIPRARAYQAATCAPTNFYLAPAGHDPLREPPSASVFATDLTGLGEGINIESGTISLRIRGVRMAGREVGPPARDAALVTTIPRLLATISAVGPAVRFYKLRGAFGGSACLIDEGVSS